MSHLIRALLLAAAGFLSLAASADDGQVKTTLKVENVVERISEIEVIDVTSERAPLDDAEPVDEDVSELLDALEEIEADELE